MRLEIIASKAKCHLASRFRPSLLVDPRHELCVVWDSSILGSRRLCHRFEQSDGLALGPTTSDPLPDGQRGQRVGESVGGRHGPSAGFGGRRRENLQVLWKSYCNDRINRAAETCRITVVSPGLLGRQTICHHLSLMQCSCWRLKFNLNSRVRHMMLIEFRQRHPSAPNHVVQL